jgi:4'-phosphopantetheinyl transferase EntD
MIGELLPAGVASAEASGSTLEELFPSELALIADAVPKRRAEFTTARQCARRALSELGLGPAPILQGSSREPLWPDGIVGSISHCPGYHAAAVARASGLRSIGIDAERDEPLPAAILDEIALPAERGQLRARWGPHLDRLLFSAKEAVYKAWFPVAGCWLGFEDALVTLYADGTFDVAVLAAGPIAVMPGRWLARDGLILTAVALPTSQMSMF